MKPMFEHTPLRRWESLHCEVVRGPDYGAAWHFHPEYQLTLIIKSRGYRLVGDNLAPLVPGDLVLVGANLPHVWRQEASIRSSRDSVHAIIVRFLGSFLGQPFLEIPEMKSVRRLLQRSARGLEVRGSTRIAAAELMRRISHAEGLRRITELLTLLDLLANASDLRPLASREFLPVLNPDDQDRMARVCRYIDEHLDSSLERPVVAAQASLSTGAFSRFFKLRTGKTFPQYVNELRVGRARRLLADTDMKVSDLALACGFDNLSNFNRRFLAIMGISPVCYRRQARRVMEG